MTKAYFNNITNNVTCSFLRTGHTSYKLKTLKKHINIIILIMRTKSSRLNFFIFQLFRYFFKLRRVPIFYGCRNFIPQTSPTNFQHSISKDKGEGRNLLNNYINYFFMSARTHRNFSMKNDEEISTKFKMFGKCCSSAF